MIAPLVSISVSTLERCVRNLKEMPFEKIIEDRIKGTRLHELRRAFTAIRRIVGARDVKASQGANIAIKAGC